MLYSDFLEALRGDAEEPEDGSEMVAYLRALARQALDRLGLATTRPAILRMAAISGLVRSCPPQELVVLQGDITLADLAGAILDIVPDRYVMLAQGAADGDWRPALPDRAWLSQISTAAQALDLPCARLRDQTQPLSQASVLATTAPVSPGDYARQMPRLACVLALKRHAAVTSAAEVGDELSCVMIPRRA
jgi:hypothetical protein